MRADTNKQERSTCHTIQHQLTLGDEVLLLSLSLTAAGSPVDPTLHSASSPSPCPASSSFIAATEHTAGLSIQQ